MRTHEWTPASWVPSQPTLTLLRGPHVTGCRLNVGPRSDDLLRNILVLTLSCELLVPHTALHGENEPTLSQLEFTRAPDPLPTTPILKPKPSYPAVARTLEQSTASLPLVLPIWVPPLSWQPVMRPDDRHPFPAWILRPHRRSIRPCLKVPRYLASQLPLFSRSRAPLRLRSSRPLWPPLTRRWVTGSIESWPLLQPRPRPLNVDRLLRPSTQLKPHSLSPTSRVVLV